MVGVRLIVGDGDAVMLLESDAVNVGQSPKPA